MTPPNTTHSVTALDSSHQYTYMHPWMRDYADPDPGRRIQTLELQRWFDNSATGFDSWPILWQCGRTKKANINIVCCTLADSTTPNWSPKPNIERHSYPSSFLYFISSIHHGYKCLSTADYSRTQPGRFSNSHIYPWLSRAWAEMFQNIEYPVNMGWAGTITSPQERG
jgi:hypothetical protein